MIGGRSRAGSIVLAAAGLVSACSAERSLFLEAAWPTGQIAVIIEADLAEKPIGTAPFYAESGRAARITRDGADPFRLYAWTYAPDTRAPNGMPLTACALSFGGDGLPLDPPLAEWSSARIEPDASGALAFAIDPSPPAFDLRFVACNEVADPCAGITHRYLPDPPDGELNSVAVVSDALAFFAGPNPTENHGPTVLGRIDAGRATIFPADRRLSGDSKLLAWDGASSIYGVTDQKTILRFDFDGHPLPAPHAQLDGKLIHLSAGLDGSLFAATQTTLFELARGSSAAVARSDFHFPPDLILDVRRDRLAVIDSDRAINVFDGTTWTVERPPAVVDGFDFVIGDGEMMLAGGLLELLLLRDEQRKQWDPLAERPFDQGQRLGWGAMAGPRRLIVTTPRGGLAVWTGGRWCRVLESSHRALRQVSVSPSGKLAYAVGTSLENTVPDVPPILEVRLP